MTHKRSVVFTTPQAKWLQQEAKKLGLTMGELVRRIVDEKREKEGG